MAGWLKTHDYDLVGIGAGSAGVRASLYAARLGARVALVEKLRIGGDCTHYGCVPSKALHKAAGVAWALCSAAQFGLAAADPAPEVSRAFIKAITRAEARVVAREHVLGHVDPCATANSLAAPRRAHWRPRSPSVAGRFCRYSHRHLCLLRPNGSRLGAKSGVSRGQAVGRCS
jgi:phytoene dehydrogenase-like protein